MTNAYNTGYGQGMENQFYQQYPQSYMDNRNSFPITGILGASALGFAGGAAVGAGIDYFKKRNPVKNGSVSDNFAKQVLDKIINSDYAYKGKTFFKQKADVIKNIDISKTPEKFRKLMEKNREYCSTLFEGLSLESVCKTVTKENIKEKISAIKKRIEASLSTELQNIKDTVNLCWDKENKKFVKPDNVDNKLFKIIEDSKNKINWKKACKYGGITAGVFGALTLGMALLNQSSQRR